MGFDELAVRIFTQRKKKGGSEEDDKEELRAQIVHSPFGSSSSYPFKPPYSEKGRTALIEALEKVVAQARSTQRIPQASAKEVREQRVREYLDIGRRLTEGLFPSPKEGEENKGIAIFLRHCLAEVRHRIANNQARGLRLRLLFDAPPNGSNMREINRMMALPWDLLTEPQKEKKDGEDASEADAEEQDSFLCRSSTHAYTPLVYSFGSWRPHQRRIPQVEPPLRVLLIFQSVLNDVNLDLAMDLRQIQQAIAGTETVDVRILAAPTMDQLRWELTQNEIHVLHFVGHGGVDDHSGEGYLLFQHSDGKEQRIMARTLASVARQSPSLRLMVFGSCFTAKVDHESGKSPYLSVAGALQQAGIPAVIAMRYPVSDPAAARLAAELYAALAAGDPVDAALAEARASLPEEYLEWLTPVLFLGAEDGQLFNLRRHPTDANEPLKIAIQSFEGWGKRLTRQSDRVLSLLPSFDGRRIREPHLWNSKILPHLRRFLAEAALMERPIVLEMQAHQTLPFAAGYLWEAKSGLDISIRQRGIRGTELWRASEGELPEGEPWKPPREETAPKNGKKSKQKKAPYLDANSPHLALALGITRPVEEDVKAFLSRQATGKSPVKFHRLLSLEVPSPAQTSVKNGAHAVALASWVADQLDRRPQEERQREDKKKGQEESVLHIFGAVPNTFLFYLGQMARSFGKIQFHEFFFGHAGATYFPTMVLSGHEVRVA